MAFLSNLFESKPQESSLVFFTLHKCASTLFADHVLPKSLKYEHVDYGKQLFNGAPCKFPLDYSHPNTVYGPIRIYTDLASQQARKVLPPLFHSQNYKNFNAIFFVRDPRDILVSRYFSYRYSHPLGTTQSTQNNILYLRNVCQNLSIDEYALSQSQMLEQNYELLHFFFSHCKTSHLFKYESMIHDFEPFYQKLSDLLDLPSSFKDELYERSRPLEQEDPHQHKRSGKTGGFLEKLNPATIKSLNHIFSRVLENFDYSESPTS